MTSRLTVCFDTRDPARVGAFWAGLLGRTAIAEGDGVLVPGSATQVGLRFVATAAAPPLRERLHLHVTSESIGEQRRRADEVLERGGARRGRGPLPFGRDLYLADPDGDGFCLIEPGNRYLARCGPLGEVTCDGTPAAGRFWAAALGWAVVWDADGQLAIQAADGGTKIGWDRWPERPIAGRGRRRFELAAEDPIAEARRLVALGATRFGGDGGPFRGTLTLADPDGELFAVRARRRWTP